MEDIVVSAEQTRDAAPELKEFKPEERREILAAMYGEVCKGHAGITDFRAKLLALLPIASGTGIGLLLTQLKGDLPSIDPLWLVAMGVFGALVTLGLFLYELRQVDVCKQLRNHAEWIEQELGIAAGQFGGRRERLSLSDVYSPRRHRDREKRLKKDETAGSRSNVKEEREKILDRPFIGAEAAGYVIYHSVIAAWLFVAGTGVAFIAAQALCRSAGEG